MVLESRFQKDVIREIHERWPDAIVLKNDPNYIQGVPDLTILNGDRWAMLECKQNARAGHRPNQEYYIERMRRMSYASFIFPENREEVFNELEQALRPGG